MAMRVKNIAAGFYDATGFHPIRSSSDYDADRAGDDYSERRRKPAAKRKKKATGRKAKPKAKAHRKRTAKAVGRKRNPIPVKWATAKVRKVGSDIQVMLFPKGRVAKRRGRRNPSSAGSLRATRAVRTMTVVEGNKRHKLNLFKDSDSRYRWYWGDRRSANDSEVSGKTVAAAITAARSAFRE